MPQSLELSLVAIALLAAIATAAWVVARNRRRNHQRLPAARPEPEPAPISPPAEPIPAAKPEPDVVEAELAPEAATPEPAAGPEPSAEPEAVAGEPQSATEPQSTSESGEKAPAREDPKARARPKAEPEPQPEARRKRVQKRPRARLPVVLLHGLFGFDEISLGKRRVEYFRGVPDRLARHGIEVSVASLSPVASVRKRARQLVRHIDQMGARKVNIVAHSMGGIDARYAISRLGLGARVASLTTIGTPHHGTPLADLGSILTRGSIGRALRVDGVKDITPAKMARFNSRMEDARGVAYGCVVASVHRGPKDVPALLMPSWLYLRGHSGANDGVVPAGSQTWGSVLVEIDADHWSQVGWGKRFDAPEFYTRLLKELRGRGF